MTKRVVVTGMALASPLGSTVESAFKRLHKLENCIKYSDELAKYNGLLRHSKLSLFLAITGCQDSKRAVIVRKS